MTKKENECKNCEDCKKYQDQAFELEVDEDLQQERLNRFWKKYHLLVYAIVFVILAATAGIQLYQSWRMKIRLEESDAFENAVLNIFAQKPDDARPVLTKLATEGRTGYKYLARLELAGLAARQNKTDDALTELNTLINSDAPDTLKAVATLSYVGYQVDTGNTKDLLKLLEPYMNDSPFMTSAVELATVLYIRDNETAKAKEALKKALLTPNLPNTAQMKLKNLLQIVESK